MRTNAIHAAILISTAISSPAWARDDSWYIEADAGVSSVDDMPLALSGTPTNILTSLPIGTQVWQTGTKTGYDFGGIVGYDFGLFRLEAEGSFRHGGADKLLAVSSGSASSFLTPGSTWDGSARQSSVMVNGMIDIGKDSGPQIYVGGGLGYSRTSIAMDYSTTGITASFDGADSGFAWQLLAGARYPLSERVDVGLKYRYFSQGNVNLIESAQVFSTSGSAPFQTHWRSHSALLTLSYNFGGNRP